MKSHYRGIAVAVFQCLLVVSIAGKYALDRERLPRVWTQAFPFDPNLPIRGRYVRLGLRVDTPPSFQSGWVQLSARDGRLFAEPAPAPYGLSASGWGDSWRLGEPVAFFIPENVPDPSRRPPGEELWVEVSVPRRGIPRPIRLGVRKDGVLTPLDLR